MALTALPTLDDLEEDIDKLIEEFKKIDEIVNNYKIIKPLPRKPRIVIYVVDNDLTEDEVQENLVSQNNDMTSEGLEVLSSFQDSMENCEMDDVDFFVNKFQNAIVYSCWKNRRKRITVGKNAIWWNPFLQMERSTFRALRRRFQATSELNERIRRKIYFKRELTKYKRTCIETKMATLRDRLDKIAVVNTFDSFYRLIDDRFSTSQDLVQMLDDNGQEIDTHSKIREYILKFHFPTIDDDEILSVQSDKISEFDLITEEEIISIFEDCKNDKSPGPDGLTMGIIKEIFFDNKSLFINLLNLCLYKGISPKVWKRAHVALIPKSGKDLRLPNNYRPICLLPVWGKVLDTILAQRLSYFLEQNNKLHDL
ncbi:hypothetical protein AVEN_129313-1 [Araneus ventricosus]|uniref:Reverse transcriptase domain-containing protein n=1 Tax=Araneus ventricosus TaxID=182803 RepID=A0A4Y2QKY3_ARAVE|nr:hypothetical protein AVEN_129313-1 [Araneus ventricosus]